MDFPFVVFRYCGQYTTAAARDWLSPLSEPPPSAACIIAFICYGYRTARLQSSFRILVTWALLANSTLWNCSKPRLMRTFRLVRRVLQFWNIFIEGLWYGDGRSTSGSSQEWPKCIGFPMAIENKSSILHAIFKIVCNQFARQNCRERVNVNATHASPCQKKQFSKTLIKTRGEADLRYKSAKH